MKLNINVSEIIFWKNAQIKRLEFNEVKIVMIWINKNVYVEYLKKTKKMYVFMRNKNSKNKQGKIR